MTERPDLKLTGHFERVTSQLDEKTRMLLAEVDLDNTNGDIVAGSLVQVTLDLKTAPGITVPSESLVLRGGKTMVPVVDDKSEVIYKEVKVIDNDGKMIKIQSGLNSGEIVALNLGNTLQDHSKVQPEASAPATVAPTTPAATAGEPKVAPETEPSTTNSAGEHETKPVAQKKSAEKE